MRHAGTANLIPDVLPTTTAVGRSGRKAMPAHSRLPAFGASAARLRRHGAAILSVGLVLSLAGPAIPAAPPPAKAPGFMITGTTMSPDGQTPVPRARITVWPESTVTYTDVDGDFIAPWDGKNGWITIVTEERARDGSEWCKRVVLTAQAPEAQLPVVDLGLIVVMPKARIGYRQQPVPPISSPRPGSFRVSGPQPGEPDTCRLQVSYGTDLWGHTTRAEIVGGDPAPASLKEAILDWLRSVRWEVFAETPCDDPEPFRALQWMDYAWADTAWVQVAGIRPERRSKPPSPTQR